jgi:hypothetical protein
MFNRSNGVIAHHYVQSFSPEDNITSEQAHQIALEWIRKVAPDFQVVVATHADTDKIHNHFIINSCNTETGKKWHGNQNTLRTLRDESDILCVANNLSVIKRGSGKSIDQATYQLSMKGKSWKLQLVNDLDAARSSCRGKLDFIDFMNKRGYAVRYTDNHITFKMRGEVKGIRADTLARQFGAKYAKVNLEKSMGIEAPPQRYYLHHDRDVGILQFKKREFREFPQKEKVAKTETELQRNSRINAELKMQSVRDNDKLCYKVISAEQLERVNLTDAKLAYFESAKAANKFNIVYLASEAGKVDYAVYDNVQVLGK